MTTTADLLRAICERPEDTDARLVYADWCEDSGDLARAEFIRLQCEVVALDNRKARLPRQDSFSALGLDNKISILRRRERELLHVHGTTWREQCFPLAARTWNDPGDEEYTFKVEWRRGFVEVVRCTLTDWYGGPCTACQGQRFHVGRSDTGKLVLGSDYDCPACSGTGHTPGHGPAIVLAQPVRVPVLTDKAPFHLGDQWTWILWAYPHETSPPMPLRYHDALPYDLFTLVQGSHPTVASFSTRDAALAALSAGALRWARQKAGLPVEEGR